MMVASSSAPTRQAGPDRIVPNASTVPQSANRRANRTICAGVTARSAAG
jgi:hypothetical protein